MNDMAREPSKWRDFLFYFKHHSIIPYGFWANYGHWCHVSVFIALDHRIRGGKIRLGRW